MFTKRDFLDNNHNIFSKDAALQLLADFNEVRNWLNECKILATAAKKQMLHNEVLRYGTYV